MTGNIALRKGGDMTEQRRDLERALVALPDVTIAPWKDTDLICVFYKGRDFAHFHNDHVIDIRLSPKIIREEALPRRIEGTAHPKRSDNSRWIEVEFYTSQDVVRVLHLVKRACAEVM